MPWQEMDTAPKDGKKFLAFTCDFEGGIPFNPCIQEAWWTNKGRQSDCFMSKNGQMVMRWMPLPAFPEFYAAKRERKWGTA